MKKVPVFCVLMIALISGSCQKGNRPETVAPVHTSPVPDLPTLTLSHGQLVFLDYDGNRISGARVAGKRIVGNSGVEFDIEFPSNEPGSRTINYVSSGSGGRGNLIGFDISSFDQFALKFTLVSINGAAGSNTGRELAVGALIGPTAAGKLSHFVPVTLGSSSGQITLISSTPVNVDKIFQIGFHAHMVDPEKWASSGSKVTIRVEPVENATVRPWPHSVAPDKQPVAPDKQRRKLSRPMIQFPF
jgi:hypothetical protein